MQVGSSSFLGSSCRPLSCRPLLAAPPGAAAGDSAEVVLSRRALLQGDLDQESRVLTTPYAPGFPFCACRTYDCK